MNKTRVGVIGAGWVAEKLHLPVLTAMPEIEVKWVCDVDSNTARRVSRTFGIKEVRRELTECSDVDIALIATPPGSRESILGTVFSRRWHAFVEKPFAATCSEHDQILDAARGAGVQVGVGFQRRLHAGTIASQRLLSESVLGPIHEIWATDGARVRSTAEGDWSWRADRRMGGGMLIEKGCHIVDQVFAISGARNFNLEECDLTYHGDLDFEFKTRGTLTLADDQRCSFAIAGSWLREFYNAIVICFAKVRLRVSFNEADPGAWLETRAGDPIARLDDQSGRANGANTGKFQAVHAEWCSFLEQCRTGRSSRVSAETARLTTEFIETCYRMRPPPREVRADRLGASSTCE